MPIRYEPVAPDLVEQLDLGHQPVAMGDEVDEHVEHLRFERDRGAVAPQFVAVGVELAAVDA